MLKRHRLSQHERAIQEESTKFGILASLFSMSYVYPFWRRQNQDRLQQELDSRTESTASTEADASDLTRTIPPCNEFELKEIPRKEVKKGQQLETLIIHSKENKEMDQEQVFEDLTIHCTPFKNAQRASLEHHKTDQSKEKIPVEGALSSAESSKKEAEITDSADFIDQEFGESETSSSTDSDEDYDQIQSLLPSFTSVLYSKDHVAMFPHKKAKLIGRLSVIKQHNVVFLTWVPSNKGETAVCKREGSLYSITPTPLSEICSITRHTPTIGWHYIIIVLTSGCSFPPLYFNNGGVRSLLAVLKQNANLARAMHDPNTYVVSETPDPLKRSLHSMDLDEVFLGCLADNDGDFDGNVFSNTITRLKKMALNTTSNLFSSDFVQENNGSSTDGHETELSISHFQESSPRAQESSADDHPSPKREESLIPNQSLLTEVGSFEVLDGLVARPTRRFDDLRRRDDWLKEITVDEFRSFFDEEGRMVKSSLFKERVFYGGLSAECRKEGWKYLFGLWKEDWTRKMCEKESRDKKRQYDAIRVQWENITSDQEKRFAKWRDRKTRIDKDVRRTDRCQQFYKHEHGEQLKALKRILLSYVMYNFDLSYCQGMSDLASPILYIMMTGINHKNSTEWNLAEAEAFWCFSDMMDRVERNFDTDQRGMHSQLLALEKLLQLLDPQLYAHFKLHDCLNFFFCFRWVLILFKREFSFFDILRLWESFFSGHKSPHFHLYMCIAVLVTHRKTILQEDMDFDTLLKFCLELSGKIDLMPTLQLASVLSTWGEPIEKDCLEDIL